MIVVIICTNIIIFIRLKSLLFFKNIKSQSRHLQYKLFILDHLFFSKNIKYHYHYYI